MKDPRRCANKYVYNTIFWENAAGNELEQIIAVFIALYVQYNLKQLMLEDSSWISFIVCICYIVLKIDLVSCISCQDTD